MQTSLASSPIFIDNSISLENAARDMANHPSISVDTESNSLYVYREQVCLIQISTPARDYLIDPLAVKDLSPLAPIFANQKQEKVFHASEYDVICLKRDFGFEFANLFDTMIAARILGESAIGLAALLQSRLGVELNKKYQRANWGIRPLTKEMLEYAGQDSHYLYPLRVILEKELREKNLIALAQEDFKLACLVPAHSSNHDQNTCWKVAGSTVVNPQEATILQALCEFRESEASRQNLPPFKVLSNETLVRISQARPTSTAELAEIKGLNERLIKRYGRNLLATIYKGEQTTPIKKPRRVRPEQKYLDRYNALRDWRKNKGKELSVDSDVVLPRDYLELIASANPRSMQELDVHMKDIPYRSKHFGKDILRVLKEQEKV
jgi:ribonuclease D